MAVNGFKIEDTVLVQYTTTKMLDKAHKDELIITRLKANFSQTSQQ